MDRNVFTAEQEKWLKALESGAYRQTHQVLHHRHADGTDAYCCLGVANEVCRLQETSDTDLLHTHNRLHLRNGQGGLLGRVPVDHHLEGKKTVSTLIGLNDGAEWTFAQIAAFIRANPWQVFTNFDAPTT